MYLPSMRQSSYTIQRSTKFALRQRLPLAVKQKHLSISAAYWAGEKRQLRRVMLAPKAVEDLLSLLSLLES